jgi:hypothetical protein
MAISGIEALGCLREGVKPRRGGPPPYYYVRRILYLQGSLR